jgi:BirA family biotin operon repressor/biotin-[acetyl-CoA-carboxylase] ligase
MSVAGAFAAAVSAAGLRYFTQIDHRVATGSTNEDAQKVLGDRAAAGTVIVADEQTAGRGRRGRQWIAPPRSGLLFTAVLPEPIRAADAWAVTFWTGICVAKALQRWDVAAQLQWPNDLLVDGRKMCGILCVSRIIGERASIACGVGVNVHRPKNRPELDAIVPPPIFLEDCAVTGENARAELLAAILAQFEAALGSLHDPASVVREWESAAGIPGTRYRLIFDDGVQVEGEAMRLSSSGGLVIRTDRGEQTIDLAAEVRALR